MEGCGKKQTLGKHKIPSEVVRSTEVIPTSSASEGPEYEFTGLRTSRLPNVPGDDSLPMTRLMKH